MSNEAKPQAPPFDGELDAASGIVNAVLLSMVIWLAFLVVIGR